jgi:hypothetical protein
LKPNAPPNERPTPATPAPATAAAPAATVALMVSDDVAVTEVTPVAVMGVLEI